MNKNDSGIYKITNKDNGKIYIGQSTNLYNRIRAHKKGEFNGNSKMKEDEGDFEIDIVEKCSIEKLDEREIYWINYYNSIEKGYNIYKGGKGGYTIRQQNKIPKNFNKFSNNIEELVNVTKLSLEYDFIQDYPSVQECARQNNIEATNVSKCIYGKFKTVEGFIYVNSKDIINKNKEEIAEMRNNLRKKLNYGEPINIKDAVPRKIYLLDDNNNILKEYSTISNARRELGLDDSSITKVCKGRLKQTKGYKFCYVEDYIN